MGPGLTRTRSVVRVFGSLPRTRPLPAHSKVPLHFQNYAILTSFFTINCVPSKIHGIPPLQKLFGEIAKHSFLKVFSCEAFPLLRAMTKINSLFGLSLVYSLSHMGYVCLDIQSHRFYISCRCSFVEDSFPFADTIIYH